LLVLLTGARLMSHQNQGNFPADSLEVWTYNIDSIKDRKQLQNAASVVGNGGIPDVILLQEVLGEFAASFLAENLGIPHFQYTDYSGDNSGLAILSKKSLENVNIHYFSESRTGYGALAAEIKIKDRIVLLCSLHLDRIPKVRSKGNVSGFTALRLLKKEIFNDTVRSRSVEELLGWLSGFDTDYIIVGGDFNTFPLSRPIRKMTEIFNDALWPTTSYFTGTYTELDYPFKPRIDFLFHSPAIKRHRADVIKKGPSDHYPVKAIFELEG